MPKNYEWSLIPYPYFRSLNLFNAFLLNALCVGIISTFANESHAYFVYLESNKNNFEQMQEQNNMAGVKFNRERDHIKSTLSELKPYDFHSALRRAIRVSLVSTILSFIVYVLMYFIFGFGGGMIAMNRQYRFFSSIPS